MSYVHEPKHFWDILSERHPADSSYANGDDIFRLQVPTLTGSHMASVPDPFELAPAPSSSMAYRFRSLLIDEEKMKQERKTLFSIPAARRMLDSTNDHASSKGVPLPYLPDEVSVKDLLMKRAKDFGLKDVAPKAVTLVSVAMEQHLRSIISATLEEERERQRLHEKEVQNQREYLMRSIDPRNPGASLRALFCEEDPTAEAASQVLGGVTMNTLLRTVQEKPYLMGEHISVVLEKISQHV